MLNMSFELLDMPTRKDSLSKKKGLAETRLAIFIGDVLIVTRQIADASRLVLFKVSWVVSLFLIENTCIFERH